MDKQVDNSICQPVTGARSCLVLLFVGAVVFGIAEVSSASYDDADPVRQLWNFVYCWTAVLWIDLDSRGRDYIKRSFDFTFLIFFFLPLYLPYYLIRTRRGWGALGLVGFGVLYMFGALLNLLVYLAD